MPTIAENGDTTRENAPVTMRMSIPTLDMIHTLVRYALEYDFQTFMDYLDDEGYENLDAAAVKTNLTAVHDTIAAAMKRILGIYEESL